MTMLTASKLLAVTTSYYVMSTIVSITELLSGILGVAYCKKPEKAQICLGAGIVLLVVIISNTILQITTYGAATGIMGIVLRSILPVLYIIGAVLNLKGKK